MTRTLLVLLCLPFAACVSTVTEGGAGASGATTTSASGSSVAGTSGTPSTSGAAAAGTTSAMAASVGATTGGATASGASTTTGSTGSTSSSGSTGSTTGSVSGCGDGIVEAGEVCDLGADNGKGLGCNITCNLFGLVTTLAGSASPGQADGFGAAAQFGRPYGLAVMGDVLYVADTSFKSIRAVELTNGDYVQTIAGGHSNGVSCTDGDGPSTDPSVGFCAPNALVPFDGGLLVTDYGALRLLSFAPTLDGGMLSMFGGTAAIGGTPVPGFDAGALGSCLYGNPSGMVLVGPNLYTNTSISGVIGVTDFADDPTDLELAASLSGILELGGMTALDGLVYTTNTANPGALYAYDPATGTLDIPGDAGFSLNPGGLNTLLSPDGVCTDGQSIYICEAEGGEGGGAAGDILQYVPATGSVTLLAGGHPFPNGGASAQPDGLGADAGFFDPAGCTWDPTRKVLYVSDRSGNEIRMIQ